MISSDPLRETALGVLEGEPGDRRSIFELSRQYQYFAMNEINTRVSGGENLHDVDARVRHFFADQDERLEGRRVRLIVESRNLTK